MPIDPGLGQGDTDAPDEPDIDPGLGGDRPYIPPVTEPQPQPDPIGILLGGTEGLMTKTQTYGGAGANCRSRSTNWGDMGSMPYWLTGSIDAPMSGSTVTLTTDSSTTDSINAVVAADSYVEISIDFAAGASVGQYQWLQDTSFRFSVCLEGGDSVSASVGGDSVLDFSIIKDGTERVAFSEVAQFNTVYSEFAITFTIDKAVHCSGPVEQDPEEWYEPHPGSPPYEEGPIDDAEEGGGGDGAADSWAWTQSDSWVLLGVLVLVLLGSFVLNTTRGDDCAT